MKKYIAIGIFLISIFLFFILSTSDNKGININNITYTNISDIPEEHYKKPEFYPTYKNLNTKNQNASYGYGAFPGEASIKVNTLKEGQYVEAYTFVHSAFEVGSYQGINLSLTSQNNELFETHLDPSDILLSPINLEAPETTPNWTYRVRMKITARKDIPKGEYVFKLIAGQPSLEKQKEYYNKSIKYVSAGMIQSGKFFDLIMKVG